MTSPLRPHGDDGPDRPDGRPEVTPSTARPGADDPGAGWTRTSAAEPPRASSPAAPPSRPPAPPAGTPTTVLPDASGGRRPPPPPRPGAPRSSRPTDRQAARPAAGRTRRARLALKRIDPWSVFVFSLIAAVFLGIALVVAVAVLYAVLSSLGVLSSINELFTEVTGGDPDSPLLSAGRIVGGTAVLAAVNVVVGTLLATLGALLYNLCASFTGGIEVTLGERDS